MPGTILVFAYSPEKILNGDPLYLKMFKVWMINYMIAIINCLVFAKYIEVYNYNNRYPGGAKNV